MTQGNAMTEETPAEQEYTVEEAYGQVTLRPCPSCGAEFRHKKRHDPRSAVTLYFDHWYCFECGAHGMRDEHFKDLKIPADLDKLSRTRKPLPPIEQVARFWGYCTNISGTSDVHEYLRKRFNRGDFQVPQEVARRLPNFYLETDVTKGWKRSRRYLILPLYDRDLELRSVIGRAIGSTKIKSMSLRGFSRRSLAMWRKGDIQKVVFVEGEIDFLAWALFGPPDLTLYGIYAGALSGRETVVERHRFSEILVATDFDDTGEKYFKEIQSKAHPTSKVRRWDPGMDGVNDSCDVIKNGGKLEWVT